MNTELSIEDENQLTSPIPWYPIDSEYMQWFASIPFIGILASQLIQGIIDREIQESTHMDRTIQLLQLKNEYKACSLVSSVLSTAIIVVTLAAPIIPAIIFGMIGIYSYMTWTHNERLIYIIKHPNTAQQASLKLLTQ